MENAARHRRNADFHARRHPGDGQGTDAEQLAKPVRRSCWATPITSPCARRRAHRRTGRAASLHALAAGRSSPTSGGFQVFSLAPMARSRPRADFRSHIDGAAGTDAGAGRSRSRKTSVPTSRCAWMSVHPPIPTPPISPCRRCGEQSAGPNAAGGPRGPTRACSPSFRVADPELRAECAGTDGIEFPGYALGGFSVGETIGADEATLARPRPVAYPKAALPDGVGRPEDILAAVQCGN